MNRWIALTLLTVLLTLGASAWADGDWNQVDPANSPSPRFGHSMIALGDGGILLFGGEDGEGNLHNDMFAFQNNNWNEVVPANDPPAPRRDHRAWARDDKMYVFGGKGESGLFNDLWSYDSDTNLWTEVTTGGPRPAPRYGHSTTPLADGSALIFGGTTASGEKLGDLWKLNADNTYTPLPGSNVEYSHHSAQVAGDYLFVFGLPGIISLCELATADWDIINRDYSYSGYGTSAVGQNAEGQEIVFIFGGYDAEGNENDVVFEFNTATAELAHRQEPMPYPLVHGASTVVNGSTQQSLNTYSQCPPGVLNCVPGAAAEELQMLFFGGISNGAPVSGTLQFFSEGAPLPDLSTSTKHVVPDTAAVGETVTYTVRLINSGPLSTTVAVTDTLPATLIPQGTPAASSGPPPIFAGQTLTWKGIVLADTPVTLTYAAELTSTTTLTPTVVNAAQIDDGLGNVYTRSAFVNGYEVFLPLVMR